MQDTLFEMPTLKVGAVYEPIGPADEREARRVRIVARLDGGYRTEKVGTFKAAAHYIADGAIHMWRRVP